MPLKQGKSAAGRSANVGEMVKAGHPVKQAVAAAYREAGEQRGPRGFQPDREPRKRGKVVPVQPKKGFNIYF